MSESTPKKIVFAPGVLEQMELDFDPAELQEVLNEIAELANSERLLTESTPVDLQQLMNEDPNLYKHLTEQLEAVEDSTPTNLH